MPFKMCWIVTNKALVLTNLIGEISYNQISSNKKFRVQILYIQKN